MRNKIIIAVVFLFVPTFPVLAQVLDSSTQTPGVIPSASPVGSVTMPVATMNSTPRPAATPKIRPSATPARTPQPSVSATSAPSNISLSPAPDKPVAGQNTAMAFVLVALGAVGGGGVAYGLFRMMLRAKNSKQETDGKDKKPDCEKIKKLLDEKKADYAHRAGESAAKQAALELLKRELEKVKEKVKETAQEKIKQGVTNFVFGEEEKSLDEQIAAFEKDIRDHVQNRFADSAPPENELSEYLKEPEMRVLLDALKNLETRRTAKHILEAAEKARTEYDGLMEKLRAVKKELSESRAMEHAAATDVESLKKNYTVCMQQIEKVTDLATVAKEIMCRTIDGATQEVDARELSFRPSVYGVAIRENQVLLVPQWDGYDFPGGGMEIGETINEAFSREIRKETGLNAERGEILVCESDFFIHPYRKTAHNTILMYFACTNITGEISTENFDADEKKYAKKAEWVDIAKIDTIKFYNPIDSVGLIRHALSKIVQ